MTEWFEATPRKKITAKERAEIFMRAKGVCALCSMKITPGQDFDVEHPTPLWASGSDDRADLVPVHSRCHKQKTAIETTQRAKETRVRNKHIGAHKSRSTMQGGRNSRFKRKMDGTLVDRATGEPIR